MAVTTPAVPASTVAAANTTGQDLDVLITGGTITFVFVNGAQVGTAAGSYNLPAGGNISITYSAAPTWAWSNPNEMSGQPAQGAENTGPGNELTDEGAPAHAVGGETGLGIAEDN